MSALPRPTPLDPAAHKSVAVAENGSGSLLTLADCRRILGTACTLTDEEIEMLRDQLTLLADATLDALLEAHRE